MALADLRFGAGLCQEGAGMADAEIIEGSIHVEVVGESFYQDALLAAVGGQRDEQGWNFDCVAELVAEPTNPYDPNAVAVMIDGRQVGHLSRQTAAIVCARLTARGRPCKVRAAIVGGWERGKDVGNFGVWLMMPPLEQL
jgi:hypothetical protein